MRKWGMLLAMSMLSGAPALVWGQGPMGAFGPDAPPPMQYPMSAFGPDPNQNRPSEFCPDPRAVERIPIIPFEEDHTPTNAFNSPGRCEENPCPFYYWSMGGMALLRQGLGQGMIVARDNQATDNGLTPAANSLIALNFNQIQPPYNWGLRATFGISSGPYAAELTGYYVFNRYTQTTIQGKLALPFSAFPTPVGFAGNNGMWLQDSQVRVNLGYEIGNVEVNFRYRENPYFEWIFGFRYFDFQERFSINTADDGSLGPPPTNGLLTTNYTEYVQNRILGPQIGFEVFQPVVPTLLLGAFTKTMAGVNFVDVAHQLIRGDNFMGPGGVNSGAIFSSVVDFGAYAEYCFNDHFRLRGGYQGLFVISVPEAHQQINFDPNVGTPSISNRSSVFFHGPIVEFAFAF